MDFLRKIYFRIHGLMRETNIRKKILLFLFIASIAVIFLAATIIEKMSLGSGDLRYTWIYYLFLPVPIASLSLGLKYKTIGYSCKKNIVGGYICIAILVFFGSYKYIFGNYRQYDYELIKKLGYEISIDFPNGEIVTNTTNFSVDSYSEISSYSLIYFKEITEIEKFEETIKESKKWSAINTSQLRSIEPIYIDDDDGNYYLIYIKELDTFNQLPMQSGIYTAYYLVYNKNENKLRVYDYSFEYLK